MRWFRNWLAAWTEWLAYRVYKFSLYRIRPPSRQLFWTGTMTVSGNWRDCVVTDEDDAR